MAIIYLVRHAESAHNVSKDVNHRDPPLTAAGQTQASSLASTFPNPESVTTIVSSPLRRTLQTTLAAFGRLIETGTARLVLDPDLQERSDLPCDTGSAVETLRAEFPTLDFSAVGGDEWFAKTGKYTADDEAVAARAAAVREKLFGIVNERDGNVVVVTHGVFMKFLAEDDDIDLPKAGWRAYTAVKGNVGGVKLVAFESD
ncbi:phosphoglycerate mutase [Echria macrotheca]|uniref:Phosphoglycerate mutase n=1 Tax=Echria macrotheca TaxID=438768 RepID=A0AAJ0FHZ1_9PEZI|nr:phosphoglycerate mutase [Echria macrotheca]